MKYITIALYCNTYRAIFFYKDLIMAQELPYPNFGGQWIKTQEYEGDRLATQLEWNLAQGLDFSIPDVDWDDKLFQIPDDLINAVHNSPKPPTIEDITIRKYGGTGIFDAFMESIHNHLEVEFNADRITGAEYATTWTSLAGLALQQAVTFALQKDKVYWDLLLGNINALTGLVNLATARVQLAIAQAQVHINRANYCLTKLKLASEDATFAYNLENMEAARAQTADSRLLDNAEVEGAVGKQKDLIDEQIISFKRNAETKVVELYTNAWVAQKTVDEGLLAPSEFQNSGVDRVLATLRNNVKL